MSLAFHPLPQDWHSSLFGASQAWHSSLFTTAVANNIWAYNDDDWDSLSCHRHQKRHKASSAEPETTVVVDTVQYQEQEALDQLITAGGLSLRICKYGENCYGRFTRCPFLHTLGDILALFKRQDLQALYRGNTIKDAEEARPQQWETRDTGDFVCHNTTQCAQATANYSLRLKHDENNYLKYPACRVFCTHCRKTRTLPVYV